MSAIEYERQLTEARNEEKSKREVVASLVRAKDDAIAQGKGNEAVLANEKLVAAQKQLVNSAIIVKACESKLNYYKKNEPDALKITGVLANDLYPQGIRHYEKLRALHAEMKSTLQKTDQLNEEMVGLANQYRQLTGDKLLTPAIPVPPALYMVRDAKFDVAPPTLDVQTASQREQQRLATLFKEQKITVDRILRLANQPWPTCPEPTCGAPMLAQRRGPNDPAYFISEDGKRAFANFRCQKHGQYTREVSFPTRVIVKNPDSMGLFAPLKQSPSHGPAEMLGLTTDQQKGGKKET